MKDNTLDIFELKADLKEELNVLLFAASLPTIQMNHPQAFFYYAKNESGGIAAAIGLEIYGSYGLLRSLVVASPFRNRGYANTLVKHLEKQALSMNLKALYLLTTSADAYFERINFERITREQVPAEIQKSDEFSDICPVSAIVMKKSYPFSDFKVES